MPMSKSKNFCDPEKISVIVPYKDFVKLLDMANNYAEVERRTKRVEEKMGAMMGIYTEILDVVREIRDNQ